MGVGLSLKTTIKHRLPNTSLPCLFIYLFIYFQFWLHRVFIAARRLSLVAASRGYSSLRCAGFSCCGARALGVQASVVAACGLSSCGSWALEHRLSSCGAWAQLLCGMWDLPGPGLEPMSLALAGGFLTTAPLGRPSCLFRYKLTIMVFPTFHTIIYFFFDKIIHNLRSN